MVSSDSSFRPVDVSMGPDGAMYLADWYNRVIGHYQASYADPQRDKHHGRIWRIASTRHEPVQARPTWNSLVSESSFLTFTRQNDGFAIKLVVDFFICHPLKSSRHWTLIDCSLLRNHQSR